MSQPWIEGVVAIVLGFVLMRFVNEILRILQ
jgi:hypothetical protein